jgi:Septum formation
VFTNDAKIEPCSRPHTAYTFAVPTLPPAIAFKGVQIQNESVQSAAAERCREAFATFIGGDQATRALARLSFTYFLPDQRGFDLGAHWVRCDVVAQQAAKTLGDLPRRIAGVLDTPAALDTYGVCSNGDPGSATTLVMCTQAHTYRALAAIRLGDAGAKYPGTGTTLSDGKARCKNLVAHRLNVTGGFTYSWTYPSNNDWLAGQRFGYCWNQTTH